MSVISTLLLIQADPSLRAGLSFGFEREGIEVVTADASGPDEISRAVARTRPQLVIAGAKAEDDGAHALAAVTRALAEANLTSPVLYVGNGIRREKALSDGATEVIDGPGFIRDVVTLGKLLASRKTVEPDRSSGQLRDHFGLFYLLRAVSRARRRCVLTLVRGLRRGELRFYDGEVTSASVGVLHGLAALHQLLLWTDASFELRPEDTSSRKQIPLRSDEVIADAERFLREVKEVAGPISPAFVYEHTPDPDPDVADSVPRQVGSVLRLFDGSRKVADVIEDSPFRMFETLRIAGRLAAAGLIRRVQTEPRRPRAYTALSIEEWLTGTEAVTTPILAEQSEPIGPPVGRAASPPKNKKKKRKGKKARKSKEIPVAQVAPAKPRGKPVDWGDVLPRRAPTEPGGVSAIVPSSAASGEIASAAANARGDEEKASVLVSPAATAASVPRPTREGALEEDPRAASAMFSRGQATEAAEAAADAASELAKRGATRSASASGEIGAARAPQMADAANEDKIVIDPEIEATPRSRTATVNLGRPKAAAAAAEPSILVGPSAAVDEAPAVKPNDAAAAAKAEIVRRAEAAEANAAADKATASKAKAAAEVAAAEAEKARAAEAKAVAEAKKAKALEAKLVAEAEKARAAEAKAVAEVEKAKAAAAAKAAANAEAKAVADRAAAAKAEAKAVADRAAAAKAEAKAVADRAAKAKAEAKAADKARADAEAKERAAAKKAAKAAAKSKSKSKSTSEAKAETTEVAGEAEAADEASASLPDLSAEPTVVVEQLAADAAAAADEMALFSDAEEAFFRAGRTIEKTAPPPVDDFVDLDEGYDLPKTFWQRLMRSPSDTGSKPE